MTAAWAAHLPPGAEPGGVDLLAEGTLTRAWAARLAEAPDSVVLEAGGAVRRAGEFDARTRRIAARLAGAGLRPGMRILMSAATSVALAEAHVAALRLGLVVVPANTAYREREVAHLVRQARPAAAVLDDAERARWVARAAESPPVLLDPAVELPDGPEPALDAAGGGDAAMILFTSGTTGAPKGAVLSHANLLASSEAVRLAWRWGREDRLVLSLPLFHLHGLGVGLHTSLLAGGAAILLPRFTPDAVFDAARDASMFFGVPTMYARLAITDRLDELGRLRLCVSGSAPLPAALFARVEAASGRQVLERYGMSETGMIASNPYAGERRPGTVGLPLPAVDVRLDDIRLDDGGTAPGDGRGGEVLVRGPNVFSGYLGADPREGFEDGWFRTGDIGAFDDAGYLRLVGRRTELIITGGLNVYPREVEEVLCGHPHVAEAAVAGVPDDAWGEVVVAWVVPAGPDLDEAAILAHAAERLAAFKRPRRLRIVASLPRNALGKVVRSGLRP